MILWHNMHVRICICNCTYLNKCSIRSVGSETWNYDRQPDRHTDRPTNRPTDRRTWGVIGKFPIEYINNAYFHHFRVKKIHKVPKHFNIPAHLDCHYSRAKRTLKSLCPHQRESFVSRPFLAICSQVSMGANFFAKISFCATPNFRRGSREM